MKKLAFLFGMIFLLWNSLAAQSFLTPDDYLINGYSKKIVGLDYDYQSCIPGLRESMLLRATSGKDFIEWETEQAPDKISKRFATFIWVAALGSSPGRAQMDLTVNDTHSFTFYTDGVPVWEVRNPNSSSLSFNSIMVDQNGDNHGYMILRIPVEKLIAGKSLRIKVTGSRANLTSWYMTFKKPVKTGVTMSPFPAIIKKGSARLQLVEAGIFYFGKETGAKIYVNGKVIDSVLLKFGYNVVNLGLQPVSETTQIDIKVIAGDFSVKNRISLDPVKKWKIKFIQHTHTDIGYTRSQTEILAEHLRYIDYALDYCDATDNYPDNAKFRWTCEAAWPVDEYLKCRPSDQVDRLIRRIKEGRIEVTGMYFNFDEIPDEQILAASLAAVGRIKARGIPVTLAMQDDVNGIGWCLNDYFNQLGVKYLNMGTHGHRALICFDKPTMFWWESPSGKRLLTFRAEHYMTGNTVMDMQYGDIDRFKNKLLNYLISLDGKHYPYTEMAIQHSGYLTDNSPPSTIASDLIRQWNDLFAWPQLSTSTAESFFNDMERDHGSEFPVIRGAWPDWWTDGFGASARETATTRLASSSLIANEAGLSMASLSGVKLPDEISKSIDLADNALLFYTEHTMGYSESVREPLSQPTMEQRALKESYAWEANRRTASIGEEAMGLLQSKFSRESAPSLIVFNTLNWIRSGLTTVYIDHQIVPAGKIAGIFDHEGNRMAVQAVSHRSDGTQWAVWLRDIPAFGYKKYLIKAIGESVTAEKPKGFTFEIRLFNTEKRLDLSYSIIKKSIISPESFYIAFPFGIKYGKHFSEVQGGVIETGKDQIKGSSNDWYTVQDFTSVRSPVTQLVIGCPEMPLMQFGAINTGRYTAGAMPQNTNLFSWPMNNYWVTNFNADQRGGHSWTYYLTTSSDVSNGFATRFGWGCRIPYLTRILPGSGTGDNNWEGFFITGWPSNILLISAEPDAGGNYFTVHLQEIDGIKTSLTLLNGLNGKALSAVEVDVTGKPVLNPPRTIGPLESKFFRIIF